MIGIGVLVSRPARGDSRPARGDTPPPSVVVVDVDESGSGIHATDLRAAIARDLDAVAVRPEDPQAAHARGTIRVAVDRNGPLLVVSYQARHEPITRAVALPPSPDAAGRAALVLAGNLARDEGTALAASLRAQHAGREADPAAQDAAPEPAPPDRAPNTTNQENVSAAWLRADRLQKTLDFYADQERTRRRAIGWTLFAVGAAALGAATALAFERPRDVWWRSALGATGAAVLGLGAYTLLDGRSFENLSAFAREDGASSLTEETWVRRAQAERLRRRFVGIGALVAAAAQTAVLAGTVAVSDGSSANAVTAELLVPIAVTAAFGVYTLAVEGPLESGRHAYEHATGAVLAEQAASYARHVHVSLVHGGATLGLGATF